MSAPNQQHFDAAISTSSTSSDILPCPLGYPDRKFYTEVLPTDWRKGTTVQFLPTACSRGSSISSLEVAKPSITEAQTYSSLHTAAEALRQGHLVSFPTETVYGLGASALHPLAAAKIFHAKQRPQDNPLIVHVSDLQMLRRLLPPDYTMPPAYHALIYAFWPGPLTLLFPVARPQTTDSTSRDDHEDNSQFNIKSNQETSGIPSIITCGQSSVGIRMPSHPLARALMALAQLPLAAPSANASGRPSTTTAQHVFHDLGGQMDSSDVGVDIGRAAEPSEKGQPRGRIPFILDGGPCDVGVESTVVDGVTAKDELRVLRPGGVGVEAIEDALRSRGLLATSTPESGKVRVRVYGKDLARSASVEQNPTTPGMKYRHYSPEAEVILLVPVPAKRTGDRTETLDETALQHSRSITALALPSPLANNAPVLSLIDVLRSTVDTRRHKRRVRFGLMSLADSPLTQAFVDGQVPANVKDQHLSSQHALSYELLEKQIHCKGVEKTRSWLSEQINSNRETRSQASTAAVFAHNGSHRKDTSPQELPEKPANPVSDMIITDSHGGNVPQKPPSYLGPPYLLSFLSNSDGTNGIRTEDASQASFMSQSSYSTVEVHPFSLGDTEHARLSAQRLFEGLRILDEGPLHHYTSSTAPFQENGNSPQNTSMAKLQDHDFSDKSEGCDILFVEALPDTGVGLAVMNRLAKAASRTIFVRV